jgi:dTDP-4-dehydrorhamnose reductase
MKILVVGSTGMLGATAKKYFPNVKTLDRSELDLSDCPYADLAMAVESKGCDILINCAGIIKQRTSVADSQMVAVNCLLPHKLSEVCSLFGMKMFHITTDCVFSGRDGQYDELNLHDALDLYGKSKSVGEPSNCMVLRTSIIGEEKRNKLSLLEWVKSNKGGNINGFTNHYWNGVTCLELCEIIEFIIKNNLYEQKLRHVFSNTVSKYELVNLINEIYKLDIQIKPHYTENKCDRTLTTVYSKVETKSIAEQIDQTRKFHGYIC